MNWIKAKMRWVGTKWSQFTSWLDRGVTKIGGPRESQNLLGFGLRLGGAVAMAPLRLAGAVGKFGYLMVTDPAKGTLFARFQASRILWSLGTIFAFGKWVPDYRYNKETKKDELVGTKFKIDMEKTIVVGYIWLCSSLIGVPLIDAGFMMWGLGFVLGPIAIMILSNLGAAMTTWRYLRFEDWLTVRDTKLRRAEADVAQVREAHIIQLGIETQRVKDVTLTLEGLSIEQKRQLLNSLAAEEGYRLETAAVDSVAKRAQIEREARKDQPLVIEDELAVETRELAGKIRDGSVTGLEATRAVELGMPLIKNVTTGRWEMRR